MRDFFSKLAATILVAGSTVSAACAGELTITTGDPSGTYYSFGQDIATVMSGSDVNVHVAESQGSVENLQRLLGYAGASENKFYQLGLVQADVLEELRQHAKGDPVLETVVNRLKVVLPLYGEEVHAIVPVDAQSANLADAMKNAVTVLGGKPDSGTRRTVQSLMQYLAIAPGEVDVKWQGGEQALQTLAFGAAGMMFDVSGMPSKLGRELITSEDELRLLDIDLPDLVNRPDSPYRSVTIPPSAYPWMTKPVKTVAVTSLLVAYAYDENTQNCEDIKNLTHTIVQKISNLKEYGHPKWRDFQLEAARQRSDLYDCAKAGMFGE